jgi:hypothetical protein
VAAALDGAVIAAALNTDAAADSYTRTGPVVNGRERLMGGAVAGVEFPDGDPGAVQDFAAALRGCAGGFAGASGTASAAAASVPTWNGLASFNFRARCGDYTSAAAAAEAVCGRAAAAIARYGHTLQDGR